MVKETIECKLCGKTMTQLGRHLKTKHGINGVIYNEQFPNAPLMSEARKAKNARKDISPNNIEFWLKKGLSNEDAQLRLIKHKKKISKNSKNKSPFSLQYWVDKGMTDIDAKKHLSESNSRDKMFFIEKYGEEIGIKKYKSMQEKKAYSNSKEKMRDIGMSSTAIDIEVDRRWNNVSKKSFITRFGEKEGLIKYNAFCVSQKIKSKRTIDYWMSQGLSKSEAKKELSRFQNRGLDFWTSKYGDVVGVVKYKKWVNECTKNLKYGGGNISKASQKFFNSLFEWLILECSNIQYFDHNQYEFMIKNESGHKLYLDCYFEFGGCKFGIEYNGDYWHANPNIYESETEISYPGGSKKARDIWYRDKLKKQDFEKEKINIMYVWEQQAIDDEIGEFCKIKEYIERIIDENNNKK